MKKMIIFVLLLLISIMFVGCTKNNGDINSVDNEILEVIKSAINFLE